MRQVPNYLIVGDGRMATHFCEYLRLLHLPYVQWARRTHSFDVLLTLRSTCTHILYLIKDSAIPLLVERLSPLFSGYHIHFSGALTLKLAHSAHPLMTFSPALYDLKAYQKIPFIIEKEGPSFESLLPGIANPHYAIDAHKKAYYHALCVMSSNFTAILWNKLFNELEQTFEIPFEAALPFLQQTLTNLEKNPQNALTGPLIRNDHRTLNPPKA